MKIKNLLTGSPTEAVYKADDKFELVSSTARKCTYSYFADPMYVFMDAEYNQYEVEGENMGDALNYLEDGMRLRSRFLRRQGHLGRTAELRGARSDLHRTRRQGRHLGQGHEAGQDLATGFELPVPLFVEIGDKIEIDTRTDEYRNRVK